MASPASAAPVPPASVTFDAARGAFAEACADGAAACAATGGTAFQGACVGWFNDREEVSALCNGAIFLDTSDQAWANAPGDYEEESDGLVVPNVRGLGHASMSADEAWAASIVAVLPAALGEFPAGTRPGSRLDKFDYKVEAVWDDDALTSLAITGAGERQTGAVGELYISMGIVPAQLLLGKRWRAWRDDGWAESSLIWVGATDSGLAQSLPRAFGGECIRRLMRVATTPAVGAPVSVGDPASAEGWRSIAQFAEVLAALATATTGDHGARGSASASLLRWHLLRVVATVASPSAWPFHHQSAILGGAGPTASLLQAVEGVLRGVAPLTFEAALRSASDHASHLSQLAMPNPASVVLTFLRALVHSAPPPPPPPPPAAGPAQAPAPAAGGASQFAAALAAAGPPAGSLWAGGAPMAVDPAFRVPHPPFGMPPPPPRGPPPGRPPAPPAAPPPAAPVPAALTHEISTGGRAARAAREASATCHANRL